MDHNLLIQWWITSVLCTTCFAPSWWILNVRHVAKGSDGMVVDFCTMLALCQISPYERPLNNFSSDLHSIFDCADYFVEKSLPVSILVVTFFQHIPFECIVTNLLCPSISTSLYELKSKLDYSQVFLIYIYSSNRSCKISESSVKC